MKKLKNSHHLINIDHTEKFHITDPPLPKVWVSSFLSVNRNGISALAIMKKLKKYPTSHLCVVLHFLIFFLVFVDFKCWEGEYVEGKRITKMGAVPGTLSNRM